MAIQIGEDDYLSVLSSVSVGEMVKEIGYKPEWKKIGLYFNPEVKYEALKTANPTHIHDGTGDFGYCTLMIAELAKQDVKMKDFLAAVDAVGLKASARRFREKYVLPPGQKVQQDPDAGKNNNNDKNHPLKPVSEEKEPNFEKEAWFVKEKPVIKGVSIAEYEGPKAVPVAIFVVNDIEKNAVLRDFKPLVGKDALFRVKKSGQWYVVGRFGNYDAVLVQTDMGGDSVLSFDRAITDWQVKILIAIGVAWGSEPNKQKLGDVLVAKEVAVYGDNDKAQNGEYNIRSHIPKAGTNILKSLKAFKDEWEFKYDNKQSSVHMGRIISAGLLVNDQDVKTQLLNIPQHKLVDIIGGDMEAKALAHVVSENNLKVQEWVMVKGICDWADGNKHKGYQPLAAAAASDFVKFVLSQPDVLDDIINPNQLTLE